MKKTLLALFLLLTATACSQPTTTQPTTTDPAAPSGHQVPRVRTEPAPERTIVEPVSMSIRDLPKASSTAPAGDRFRRRIESSLSDAEIAMLQGQALNLPADEQIQVLSNQGGITFELGTNFDSIDVNECCSSGTLNPPDPEMAAGPNHVIAVVNNSLEIYSTDGTSVVGPTPLDTFYATLGGDCLGFPFDPNAMYDDEEDRFLVGADGNGTTYCLAVSQTGDPTGDWFLYGFPVNVNGEFFDYPHAGVGKEAIYIGSNMFGGGTGRAFAFEKAPMYAGDPAQSATQDLGSNSTPQPLKMHGTFPEGPHYFLTSRGGSGNPNTFGLYSWADPFGANTFTDVATLDVAAAHGVTLGFPVSSLQQGGGVVAGNDARGLDFEYRDGAGWMASHASCNPGGGTVNCIQWAEVDLADASVTQAGVFSSDGDYRYFPDIAVNACGDAVVGYTKSSSSSFPGVWAAGRKAGDPLGTMQGELLGKAGETFANEPDRWGDYTGMTIGPDGATFWYLGEYAKALGPGRNWGTYIASFTFPDCESSDIIFDDDFETGDATGWPASN